MCNGAEESALLCVLRTFVFLLHGCFVFGSQDFHFLRRRNVDHADSVVVDIENSL